jgi:hypothetical protein
MELEKDIKNAQNYHLWHQLPYPIRQNWWTFYPK